MHRDRDVNSAKNLKRLATDTAVLPKASTATMLCTDVARVVSGGKVTLARYAFCLQEGSVRAQKRERFCAHLEEQMV
jgi:hypothetical protein